MHVFDHSQDGQVIFYSSNGEPIKAASKCRAALLKMCLQTEEKVVTKSCENLHVL